MPRCLSRPAHLPALFLALAGAASAQDIELQAPADIVPLLSPYLPEESLAAPGAREQARRRLEKSLPELLATEGYFQPRLEFSEKDGVLAVRVDPGPRTVVAAADITIAGDLEDTRRRALVASWPLPAGKPFRQADWTAAKQQMLTWLLAAGHAAAALADSRAEIDPEAGKAYLRASYAAGPPYRFGPLVIEGLERYSPELVERYNRSVKPGEPYREGRLAALQNALQSTPYFSSVQVEVERGGTPGPDGTVTAPVRIQLRERPPSRIALGVGFSSNTGARVEANYHTADLFRKAWELNSGIRLEQRRQTAYADVFLPPDRRNYRHSFGALVERTDIQNLVTERYAIGAQRLQRRGSVDMLLSVNWQEERQLPEGGLATTQRALAFDSLWTWRRVDSLLDPREGIVLQARIGGASQALFSDRDFIRLHGRYQQFFPIGRRDVLTLRGELGQTLAESREGIPQEYLFRAGGTNSVRGYAYQNLGVREGNAVVGGRYLAVASAEYTHWLDDKWGVAAFVDAGDATDDYGRFRAALGYGLGARWKSPAGPIAVDLAYGERTQSFQLHFSLAIPF